MSYVPTYDASLMPMLGNMQNSKNLHLEKVSADKMDSSFFLGPKEATPESPTSGFSPLTTVTDNQVFPVRCILVPVPD